MTASRSERRGRSDSIARSPRGASRGFQIGPRIRIGGSIGHAAQKLKEGVGKVEKAIAPAAMLIPGVGQIAAPILNTAGHLFDTSDGGVHLTTLPKLALEDAGLYGGGKMAGAIEGKLANTSLGQSVLSKFGLGSKVPMSAAGDVAGASGVGGGAIPDSALQWTERIPTAGGVDTAEPAWMHLAKSVYGGVKNAVTGGSGGKTSALDKLLLGAGVVDQALERKKINDLYNKGEHFAEDSYNQRAPLRNTSLSILENSFTNSPNPYTQRYLSAKAPVGG